MDGEFEMMEELTTKWPETEMRPRNDAGEQKDGN